MKRTCRFLPLMLALALALLSACGGGPQPDTDETVTAAFVELLAEDYQVYYLIYGDGLAVDLNALGETDPGDYAPVVTEGCTTRAGLEARFKEVYALDETVKSLLSARDSDGRDRFQVRDGALWRSTSLSAFPYETVEGSIVLKSRSDSSASFVFEENGLDGSLYETAMSMSKTSRGWRLDRPRKEAERTLLREGAAVDSLVPVGAARTAAEDFLAALRGGDWEQIKAAVGIDGESGAWQEITITGAEITAAAEDLDSYGDYTVRVTVENGAGVFPQGTGDYRLVLTCNMMRWGEDQVIPVYFRPVGESYYNWSPFQVTSREENIPGWYVNAFIGFYGSTVFASPQELPPETVAEFSMVLTEPEREDLIYTREELSAAVESCFGIAGFDGRSTKFYSKEQGGYLLWGRGSGIHDFLMELPRTANGQSQVDVTFCRDPLCTSRLRTIRYTLADNGDGSWRFVSAVQIEK